MNSRARATSISPVVRAKVAERDGWCVLCGNPYGLQCAHYIPRSQGGLGVEENLVMLCAVCHADYDNGAHRNDYGAAIRRYLMERYSDWDEKKLYYKKYGGIA